MVCNRTRPVSVVKERKSRFVIVANLSGKTAAEIDEILRGGEGDEAGGLPVLTRAMLLDVARVKVKQFARRREMAEEETSFV